MHRSSVFLVVMLSVSGLGCAGSSIHSETKRLTRMPPMETDFDGLWGEALQAQPDGAVQVLYRSDELASDLWMKRENGSLAEDAPTRQTPRLDGFLGRLTPQETASFVEASDPKGPRRW